MIQNINLIIFILMLCTSVRADSVTTKENIFTPNQTSATLLVNYAEKLKDNADSASVEEAEKKYLLMYDIHKSEKLFITQQSIFLVFYHFWVSRTFMAITQYYIQSES